MKVIDVEQIPTYIDEIVRSKSNMNIMFISAPGAGKTRVINRWAKDNGYYLKTLILSQLDPAEALGVPVISERTYNGKTYKTMTTAIPEWVFELAEHDKAMVYLDEVLCAQPDMMNSFLNMLSEHRVGDIDLSHVIFVSSTNIVGKYIFDPDQNFIDRFCFFYVKNTTYMDYLNSIGNKIPNTYEDDYDMSHEIFSPRPLVPRCQEWLIPIGGELVGDFYQGFTNRVFIMYHENPYINGLLVGAVGSHGDVSDQDAKTIAGSIYLKYRRANPNTLLSQFSEQVSASAAQKIIDEFTNLKNN